MAKKTKRLQDHDTPRFNDPEVERPLPPVEKKTQEQHESDIRIQAAAELTRELVKGKGRTRASFIDVAEASVAAFRGAQGIAARLRIEYEFAPRGSKQRTDILKTLGEMVSKLRDSNVDSTSVASLSDEEIEAEILDILNNSQVKDAGSPKTDEGKLLLESALMAEGEKEFAALEEEIRQLDQSHSIDLLAADLIEEERNKAMVDKGISTAVVPPKSLIEDGDEEEYDFEEVVYDE